MQGTVVSLNVGAAGELVSGNRTIATAYGKTAVDGPLRLAVLGFPGDEHVYVHHGGPDKAVCVYPYEHYAYWEQRLGLELPEYAAFGENFTLTGLVESDTWLGDVFTVGGAVVQVTQPRAPCYKIAARYGVVKMALYVQQEGRTGYLLRVLQEGEVQAGDVMRLIDRQDHAITVAEANRILNADKHDVDGAKRLLAVADLTPDLVGPLTRRIVQHGSPEDLDRLYGEHAAG